MVEKRFNQLGMPDIERFENYLPTAFSSELTLLQKVNKIIQDLIRNFDLTNEMVDYLNNFIETFDENLYETVDDILNEWLKNDKLAKFIRDLINEEVIEARTDYLGKKYGNLKERLDSEKADIVEVTNQLAHKANKDEVTNIMTPKGNKLYNSLPTTGNTIGDYYYCPDGDGVNGPGNYVWNGTAWYFGGTGDEGYNKLKEDLVNTNQILNVLYVKNANLTPSNATYNHLLFTQTAIFPRLYGLTKNKKYRVVIKPIDDVNISLKAFKDGSFLKEYKVYQNIKGNEIFITDILWEYDSEVGLCIVNETIYDLSPMYIGIYDTTDLNNIQISAIDKPVALFQKYNPLTWYKNKKLTALGDSVTEQARYLNFLKDTLYFNTIQNCGEGGTTVAGTSPHAMNNDERINKMDNTSDVVLFMGGINDWVQNIQLGNIDDTDISTFYGALNSIAEKLTNKYPTKLIVFMGTTYAIYHGDQFSEDGLKNANGSTTKDYSDCIMNVSKKYGIPFVDLYGNCGWNKFNIDSFVTNDGAYLHPNENGGKRMGRIIYSKLIEIMPSDYIS